MVMNVSNALSAYRQADIGTLAKGIEAPALDKNGGSFSDALGDFLGDAVSAVKKSEEMAAQGTVGKADLQEVILAVSNAEIMMQAVTSIRDKVIGAYQEVIRTSI